MTDAPRRRSSVSASLSLTLLSPLGEVRPPEHVQQTDLAATLAVGLGLPIPQHSVGRFLFPVVQGRAMREQLRFLHLNAVQLSRLLQASVPVYERGELWPPSVRLGLPCAWSSLLLAVQAALLSELGHHREQHPEAVVSVTCSHKCIQSTSGNSSHSVSVWTAGPGCPHGAQLERESRRWPLVSGGVQVARA